MSNGRMILGLGAGHTPAEWTMGGCPYPSAADRAGRLGEMVEVVTGLLDGEVVSFRGRHVAADDAFLRVAIVRRAAATRTPDLVLDALVQHVEITDHRHEAANRFARTAPGLTATDVLGSPYALIGTVDEIVADLRRYRDQWGFTSYVVRTDAIDAAAAIMRHLHSG